MSERPQVRRPAVFRLDDPQILVGEPGAEVRVGSRTQIVLDPERDLAALPVPTETLPLVPKRRFPWTALFWSAAGGLVSMGLSLAAMRVVEDLFARTPWLGWSGLALVTVAAVALIAVIVRETIGLWRLAAVEKLRGRAVLALARDDRDSARSLVRDLLSFTRSLPRLARARVSLESHLGDIIDGADLVRLAERELMPALDGEAKRLVSAAAKRVSVVTAVSPRAAIDMAFVLITAVKLIRALAELYGGRPGTLGLLRLVRLVITHLAVTGGMAAGDSIVQQVLGHGIAAKLSARLGEGVLNGLLTARLGLAAIEVARPLPFTALPPPALRDLAGGLMTRRADEAAGPANN